MSALGCYKECEICLCHECLNRKKCGVCIDCIVNDFVTECKNHIVNTIPTNTK